MNSKTKLELNIDKETYRDIESLSAELGLSKEEMAEFLIERSLYDKKISDFEKNMIKGYASMGTLNVKMAEDAVTSDNEALALAEEYLIGE